LLLSHPFFPATHFHLLFVVILCALIRARKSECGLEPKCVGGLELL
jgi:hypothetical protein